MASDSSFVDFVVEQMGRAGEITSRKMFGEYAIYCDGKVIGLICDNQLFIKSTPGGRNFIGNVVEAPAYPGAKPGFLIEDGLDDREWLAELVRITALEVPEPKAKRAKRGSE